MKRTYEKCAFASNAPLGVVVKTTTSAMTRGRKMIFQFGRDKARPRVVVKVVASGVNPVDAKYLVGDKCPTFVSRLARNSVEGQGVGFDFAGVVVEADGKGDFAVGDEVFGCAEPGAGSIAQYVNVPCDQIVAKPKSMPWREAASIGLVGTTVVQSLDRLRTPKSLAPSPALVVGASGGLGHVAVQCLASEGADVVGVCSVRNLDFVRSLHSSGRVIAVPYDDPAKNLESHLAESVARFGPFALVVDCVTSNNAGDRAFDYPNRIRPYVDHRGMYLTYGGRPMQWAWALLKRVGPIDRVFHPFKDEHDAHQTMEWVYFRQCERQLRYLTEHRDVRPRVSARFPFTNQGIRDAMEAMLSRRVVGKIVIDVDADILRESDDAQPDVAPKKGKQTKSK